MSTKAPPCAAKEDVAALARDLVEGIAAIATPPPLGATSSGSGPARSSSARAPSFSSSRSLLENGARFASPILPADAPHRLLKSTLLRALRVVTRDQGVYNLVLLDAVRVALQEAESFAREATSAVDARFADEARALRDEIASARQAVSERLDALEGRIARERDDATRRLTALESDLPRHVDAFGAEIRNALERLDALERDRDARFEALARRQETKDEESRLAGEKVAALDAGLRLLRQEWTGLRQEVAEGVLTRGGAGESAPAATPSAGDPFRAGLYADFESHFRGSEAEIRERQTKDVALFVGAPGPVADLGCGRGEFLDALKAAGISGIGCDANGLFVTRAREKGLAVDKADLFSWLSAQKDGSLGGITAYQVVEHLPPASLLDLVDLAVRKLAPRGRLLFETVNPESLYAMKWFWMDLTHVRPVPAPSLVHLMTQAGLADVAVDFRSPVPASEGLLESDANGPLANVARLLFAPQDYAVTGVK